MMKMLLQRGRNGIVHIYSKDTLDDKHKIVWSVAVCGRFEKYYPKPWDGRPITCEECLRRLREGV